VLDPIDLFTSPLPAPPAGLERPVLIEALDGFVDAGSGRRLAREHLINALDSELLVSFDVDQLFDYRARRPEMTFTTDHWDGYSAPQLGVHLVRDLNDKPFLLLQGPEPDFQWERFIAAVGLLVKELDVRLVIGLTSIPMAVPHTRPLTVIAHGTPPELVADEPKWLPTVQVPASVGNLLEYRLGQAETPALGFAVAVPYYLANLDYPQAAHTLLTSAARAGDLELPVDALAQAAQVVRADVDKQIADNEEVTNVVHGLEKQYDDLATQRAGGLLASGTRLPTADELGAEFEKYLSNRPDKET
jgi:predicted ATP-grasp superfamily ATP-dependent carboligase